VEKEKKLSLRFKNFLESSMSEKRVYETTFIVTPDLEPAVYKEMTEKFTKLLTDNGAEIINQEVWGFRKLAYPIRKKETGYYVYTEFLAPASELIQTLEREYQYDERLMRYLTVKLDKHAVEWNVKRKQRQNQN
jgi:small subunit ribosomal protein S6